MLQQRTTTKASGSNERTTGKQSFIEKKRFLQPKGISKVQRDALEASDRESLLPSQSLWTLYNLAQWGDRWL